MLDGVADRAREDPRLRGLRVVKAESGATAPDGGGLLLHAQIGENGDPGGKTRAFIDLLSSTVGGTASMAVHKYCYTDLHAAGSPDSVFESYRRGIEELRRIRPDLVLLHMTMPLTAPEPLPAMLVKRVLGRPTVAAANANRERFNQLVRAQYAGSEPVFDLARLESTDSSGRRVTVRLGDASVPVLAPEYTDDGGHLNQAGRRWVASNFLQFLAQVNP
jgi:hypothetical protein